MQPISTTSAHHHLKSAPINLQTLCCNFILGSTSLQGFFQRKGPSPPLTFCSIIPLEHLHHCPPNRRRQGCRHSRVGAPTLHPSFGDAVPTPAHKLFIQYVDIEVMVCHCLENDTALLVDPLPRKRAILPAPMHTVNASEHPRKPSCCILFQDPSCIICPWCSQIVFTKHLYDGSTKHVEGL
jgi:hypothetical protein